MKVKRHTRAHIREQRERWISKRVNYIKRGKFFHSLSDYVIENPGRYAKRDPFDCGNPKCVLCHHEKLRGIPHRRDVKQLASTGGLTP